MKKAKKQTELEKLLRIKTRVNKDLDKYAEQTLFPEKLERANEILRKADLSAIFNEKNKKAH